MAALYYQTDTFIDVPKIHPDIFGFFKNAINPNKTGLHSMIFLLIDLPVGLWVLKCLKYILSDI